MCNDVFGTGLILFRLNTYIFVLFQTLSVFYKIRPITNPQGYDLINGVFILEINVEHMKSSNVKIKRIQWEREMSENLHEG